MRQNVSTAVNDKDRCKWRKELWLELQYETGTRRGRISKGDGERTTPEVG